MKPVYTSEWGQCFGACVSSVLELELTDVPRIPNRFDEFCETHRELYPRGMTIEAYKANPTILLETAFYQKFCEWIESTRAEFTADVERIWREWFAERGLVCHSFAAPAFAVPGYSIAGCQYGAHSHTLVLLDGKTVHDPDPHFSTDKPEFPWVVKTVHVIAPRNPAILLRKNVG